MILFFVSLFVCAALSGSTTCRDRTKWPFSSTSIWNMPIGSAAEFFDANIFDGSTNHPLPKFFWADIDYFFIVNKNDSLLPWYDQGHWGNGGYDQYCLITGKLIGDILFPSSTILTYYGHNNAAAILQPDNITLFQMQPIYHCNNSGPIFALDYAFTGPSYGVAQNVSILGNGRFGAHGGSYLSSIGGTIRKGELTDNNNIDSIKHVLKIELWGQQYYYPNPCYIWPSYKCSHPNDGKNKYLMEGSLLSIPSSIKISSLNITTIPGKKIFWTLQNYGGYIVDDTATNRGTLCLENGVEEEFEQKYGYPFESFPGSDFYNDLLQIFQSLKIVINNANTTIGGGGNPLQPLAPPICGA